jgi:L-alanine-DL-glutamate epimerase-like enolase superfamily enzyme
MPAMAIVGEASVSAETLLHGVIAPLLMDSTLPGIQPIIRQIDLTLGANLQLKFAIEEALLDLQAKRLGTPVFNLMGGLCRTEVPVMRMLGLKSPAETANEAQALVQRGFRYIKLKIGLEERRDIETVRRVREAVGDDVFVSVDANQAYHPMEAVQVLNRMRDCRLGIVEQPVRHDDVRGMAFVRQHVEVPVMADEGVQTAADALRFLETGAMDAVSIKLWKMGGFYKAREIASVCSAANVGVHIGSTAGSQLLEAAQLHFAASIPDLMAGAEIGEFESLSDDPASGLMLTDGALRVPAAPGLGVEIDPSKLRETSVS